MQIAQPPDPPALYPTVTHPNLWIGNDPPNPLSRRTARVLVFLFCLRCRRYRSDLQRDGRVAMGMYLVARLYVYLNRL